MLEPLLDASLRGDRQELTSLMRSHTERLVATARKVTRRAADAGRPCFRDTACLSQVCRAGVCL